jgi:excisionase family DNA binding protein
VKLLTPKEAAQQAKVSRSLVYSWCEERRLPHLRAGTAGKRGRILIREEDLLALLEECRVDRHPLLQFAGRNRERE